MAYLDVIIDGSGPHLDRFFTYRVPSELDGQIAVGHYVKVPWGKKSKGAVVAALKEELPDGLEGVEIKEIEALIDSRVVADALRLRLAGWLRDFYFGTWPEALRCLLPGPVLQSLRRGGTKSRRRRSAEGSAPEPDTAPSLTAAQESVWNELESRFDQGETFLLHGVTGSGKTEIYLRATSKCLSLGKTALVLVPEVALTPQTQHRYRARFGEEVCILHSGLTGAQRRDQWWRIIDGKAKVVVGTRSAIFAPLKECGLIVLDEEHDSSYKQASDIRYHARQVAAWLSNQSGATVVLGSATPSLESYTLAQKGRYRLLELSERISGHGLPKVTLLKGHGLPHTVLRALEERKARGEQSVLLLNRRGFSTYLQCADCDWVPECQNCSISLTFHRRAGRLLCHYCGAAQSAPSGCAECGGHRLEYPGRGTERVEQELSVRAPELRVARLDRDTVAGKASVFSQTFDAFARGEYDCLLGTQMVAKGLDFPKVTLVVVLEADTGLHLPDFRAAERTFSLLTQVAGRSGRGDVAGEVICVCRDPEQPIFRQLLEHRWHEFIYQEQQARQMFRYPPYSRLLRILLSDESEERLEKFAERLSDVLLQTVSGVESVEVMGPAPCPLERIQGRYRWHVLLKASRVQDLQSIVRKLDRTLTLGKTRMVYDPDPLDLL